MATNNAPKHDFAPAWLKIPNSENSKPSGTKQGKRFAPGPSKQFRHHSVDDDYYGYGYPYGYYGNGYGGYHDKYGMHYGSQPTLVPPRPGGQRDSKYQHPHARYGGGQGMNVGYPPYYDFIPPYEYYPNDPYYNNYPSRGGPKRSYYEKEGRSNSKEEKNKEEKKDKETEKDKPFNDDFPSLNGEEKSGKGNKQVNGTGVWENRPISKSGSSRSAEDTTDASQNKVLRDTNIYKNLVPNKTPVPRRPGRVNGSYPRSGGGSGDQGMFTGLKPSTPTSTSSSGSPGPSKEGTSQPVTPPIDILNTRFVTQPKTLSDKKSHFLKTLRQENSEQTDKKGRPGDEDLVNGVDGLNLQHDSSNLSSSLEAEQRLLRDMGWNEADEEDYEITEAEMAEFFSKQQGGQHNTPRATNGLRNGFTVSASTAGGSVKTISGALPKATTWSPKHIPVYQPNPTELNDTLSSSDSDSDDADN